MIQLLRNRFKSGMANYAAMESGGTLELRIKSDGHHFGEQQKKSALAFLHQSLPVQAKKAATQT